MIQDRLLDGFYRSPASDPVSQIAPRDPLVHRGREVLTCPLTGVEGRSQLGRQSFSHSNDVPEGFAVVPSIAPLIERARASEHGLLRQVQGSWVPSIVSQ